ncbi:MAG: DUF2281 domain-containing protein [Bacteroidia bacterium]|nr:DUF2281 domain-containing protein [Bacteroidia bacterium]
MTDRLILQQLKQMPANLQQEVLDYMEYLMAKYKVKPILSSPKSTFGRYRGSLNSGLTVEEIDTQLKQLRDEWERPIF